MQKYLLLPLPDGPLRGLDLITRAVLGAIYDRYRLSSYRVTGGDETFIDADGLIFCVYSQAELAAQVGVSDRAVRRSLATLRQCGMIISRKTSYSGACRFYVTEYVRDWLRVKNLASQSGLFGLTGRINPDSQAT